MCIALILSPELYFRRNYIQDVRRESNKGRACLPRHGWRAPRHCCCGPTQARLHQVDRHRPPHVHARLQTQHQTKRERVRSGLSHTHNKTISVTNHLCATIPHRGNIVNSAQSRPVNIVEKHRDNKFNGRSGGLCVCLCDTMSYTRVNENSKTKSNKICTMYCAYGT